VQLVTDAESAAAEERKEIEAAIALAKAEMAKAAKQPGPLEDNVPCQVP
jgi:hypothetical protein